MAGMTYWNGTSEVPVTLTRWTGTSEVAVSPYRWDGSAETPCFTTADPFIGATNASHPSAGSSTGINLTIPTGIVSTDRCALVLCNANSAATITSVTGCSPLLAATDTGTMQAAIYGGTGHTAGGTLAIVGTNLNPSAVAVVWHRGRVHDVLATPATRGASSTTIAAAAAPNAVSGDLVLVLVAEKSGANTDNLAPVVSGVTQRSWAPWNGSGTGLPSAYIGEYVAPASSKTATYLRASANALATQVRLA